MSSDRRDLHSFPTRRSSDLLCHRLAGQRRHIVEQLDGLSDEQLRTPVLPSGWSDRKSTRLNSSHVEISYAVFCLKKKNEFNDTKTISSPSNLRHCSSRKLNY